MKSTAIMKPTLVKDNQPYHAAVGSEVDGRRFQNYFCEVTSESEFKESASRKKVHFTPPSSPVLFEERVVTNKNQSMLNQEHTRCLGVIFSIFSVSVAIAAVTGCVFLYYNMKENQSQISVLRKELLGSSKFHSKREGFSGWINYIQEKTFQMNSEIEKMKAWANVSTCLKGHDFTKGSSFFHSDEIQGESMSDPSDRDDTDDGRLYLNLHDVEDCVNIPALHLLGIAAKRSNERI
ncbi:unnamed protein product [Clavelina lepadiformis]|uniref:Uncharacterized protein n=1 Tax=Clavelina lepadiformis TaxID=159417 RepID=A0ABP0FKJ2_CLALP